MDEFRIISDTTCVFLTNKSDTTITTGGYIFENTNNIWFNDTKIN